MTQQQQTKQLRHQQHSPTVGDPQQHSMKPLLSSPSQIANQQQVASSSVATHHPPPATATVDDSTLNPQQMVMMPPAAAPQPTLPQPGFGAPILHPLPSNITPQPMQIMQQTPVQGNSLLLMEEHAEFLELS